MRKLRVGDKVLVLSGKDKGREGEILRVFPKAGKAIVGGVNMYKKHVKKALAADGKGGVYEIPRAINLSKLSAIDPKTKKKTRVGFAIVKDVKTRISKSSKENLDKAIKLKTKKK